MNFKSLTLCGKEHKNVIADVDALVAEINSAENPAEWERALPRSA